MNSAVTIPDTWQSGMGRVIRLKSSSRPPYHATHAIVVSEMGEKFILQREVLNPYNLRLGDALRQGDYIYFWYENAAKTGNPDNQIRRLISVVCEDTEDSANFRLPQIGQQWEGEIVTLLPGGKQGFIEVFEPELFFHFFFGKDAFADCECKQLKIGERVRFTVGRNNKGFCAKQASMI